MWITVDKAEDNVDNLRKTVNRGVDNGRPE